MSNKITVGILMLMLASGLVFISWDRDSDKVRLMSEDDYIEAETNYIGLFKLGLAPNADSRQPQKNDIDTGIKLKNGDNVYSLIESRTWSTKDYGKTFIIKVN